MVRCLYGLLLVIAVAVSDCPPGCCCPRPGGAVSLVLCEALGLRSVPRSLPPATIVLSVAHNHLCDVDHLLGPLEALRELSLSHNQLPRFPRGLPPGLEALELRGNRIAYLTAGGGLRQLANLTRLGLEDNRIRAIQPGAFRALASLQVLGLRGNRLRSLPPVLPASLAHLDLSANRIVALDPASLAGLVNLQVLEVSGNCLRSVPERAFDGMRRLRAVGLADNPWACECGLLYLYRWLLDGRLRQAARLLCSAPRHLARRPLLALPVADICPLGGLGHDNSTITPGNDAGAPSFAASNGVAKVLFPTIWAPTTMFEDSGPSPAAPAGITPDRKSTSSEDGPLHTRLKQTRYTLEELSYTDCPPSNSTPAPVPAPPTRGPQEGPRCIIDPGSLHPPETSTAPRTPGPVLPTNKAGVLLAPAPTGPTGAWGPGGPWGPTPIKAHLALLALLCILVALLLVVVAVLLKKVLRRNQRVAPVQLP